jgi:hypothetical protein
MRVTLLVFSLFLCSCSGQISSGDYDDIIMLRDRLMADPRDSKSLSRLIDYLDDHFRISDLNGLDSGNAAGCLRQLGDGPQNQKRIVPIIAPVAVPALIKGAMASRRPAAIRSMTEALCNYGPFVAPYKTQLVAIMQAYPDYDVAWFAAEALGNLGPSAIDVLPALDALPLPSNPGGKETIARAKRKIMGLQSDLRP